MSELCPILPNSTRMPSVRSCLLVVDQLESSHSLLTLATYGGQISDGQSQCDKNSPVEVQQFLFRLLAIQNPAISLNSFHHALDPEHPSRCWTVNVVQTSSDLPKDRQRQLFSRRKKCVSIFLVLRKRHSTQAVVVQTSQNALNFYAHVDQLRGHLDQHQKLLCVLLVACPFGLHSSNARSLLACSVGGYPKPPNRVCRGGSHAYSYPRNTDSRYASENCGERSDRAPRFPPDMAIVRDGPALTNAIQHAHSLIPLWTVRHSAMAPLHTERAHG